MKALIQAVLFLLIVSTIGMVSSSDNDLVFPTDMRFGAATAAYQIVSLTRLWYH